MSNDEAKHARFFGRVQGINFRRNVFRKAVELGLRGWVTNLPDGSVEALFIGSANAVSAIVTYCLNDVPMARIDSHSVVDGKDDGSDTFRIL